MSDKINLGIIQMNDIYLEEIWREVRVEVKFSKEDSQAFMKLYGGLSYLNKKLWVR